MRAAFLLLAAAPLIGCIAPITPMERLQQSANEVAGALRFNRTDLAAEYCSAVSHDAFLARHAVWTQKTRVVDLELSGIFLRSPEEAEAIVSVSWLTEDGAELHVTEISQRWKRDVAGFKLADEVFRGGDKALFDMIPKKEDATKAAAKGSAEPASSEPASAPVAPHARLETRTIRDE